MAEFTPIETQEALNAIIVERVEQAKRSVRKEFEGYLSPEDVASKYEGYLSADEVKEKYKGYLSPEDAAIKDAKLKQYETDSVKTRIALEAGLPYDMVSRVQGDSEEALKKDAEKLAGWIKNTYHEPPLRSTEPNVDLKDKALKGMLKELKGE